MKTPKKLSYEDAIQELCQAYGYVSKRCQDPPDDMFEELIDLLRETGEALGDEDDEGEL